jgi:HSP20 family protein
MALEFRDGESLVIQADLPELDPEKDIEIWVSHGVLHIRARTPLGLDDRVRSSDLRDGTFARDLALPPSAVGRAVQATYADGRLEVRAPGEGRREATDGRVEVSRVGNDGGAVTGVVQLR